MGFHRSVMDQRHHFINLIPIFDIIVNFNAILDYHFLARDSHVIDHFRKSLVIFRDMRIQEEHDVKNRLISSQSCEN